jgi:hypothetical protein
MDETRDTTIGIAPSGLPLSRDHGFEVGAERFSHSVIGQHSYAVPRNHVQPFGVEEGAQ